MCNTVHGSMSIVSEWRCNMVKRKGPQQWPFRLLEIECELLLISQRWETFVSSIQTAPHTVLQATNTQLRQEEFVYTAGGHLVEHQCELLISFLLLGDVLLKVVHFCIHATHLLLLVTGGGEEGGRRGRKRSVVYR